MAQTDLRKKEIYTYTAPWPIYGMNWSVRADKKFRLALGSFVEDYTNKVEIVQLNEETSEFVSRGSFSHSYPATKIMWMPDKMGTHSDLLATTGDYLRLWEVGDNGVELKSLLNNVSARKMIDNVSRVYQNFVLTHFPSTEQKLRILCSPYIVRLE
jgi:hypothetical protein